MRSTYIAKFRRILTSCTHKMDRSDAVQKMEETAGTNLFSRRSAAKRCQLGQASRELSKVETDIHNSCDTFLEFQITDKGEGTTKSQPPSMDSAI